MLMSGACVFFAYGFSMAKGVVPSGRGGRITGGGGSKDMCFGLVSDVCGDLCVWVESVAVLVFSRGAVLRESAVTREGRLLMAGV